MARRILIDALAARYGGTAYAAIQVARHLDRRQEVASVVVLTRRGSIIQRGLSGEHAVKCIVLPPARRLELIRRIAWEGSRLPALTRHHRCDVIISMSGMLPRGLDPRVMCLVSNPVVYERTTPANLVRRWAIRRTARAAEYLAAPSGVMAGLVSASARRPCAVLPWGVNHDAFSPAAEPGEEILCVADFYRHKRHDLLLSAWLQLSAPRPRLRLIGNPNVDPRAYADLLTRIESVPERRSIALESRVSLDRLVRAYRDARVFVMPSEHESFCMPLAESMACGVPVVARDIDSLRETGGDAATYVAGDDPARWAAAVRGLLEDNAAHGRAREQGIRAGARFSWENVAAQLVSQF
jgi:glycosyltransferase involved in cell wall biosynthesis